MPQNFGKKLMISNNTFILLLYMLIQDAEKSQLFLIFGEKLETFSECFSDTIQMLVLQMTHLIKLFFFFNFL